MTVFNSLIPFTKIIISDESTLSLSKVKIYKFGNISESLGILFEISSEVFFICNKNIALKSKPYNFSKTSKLWLIPWFSLSILIVLILLVFFIASITSSLSLSYLLGEERLKVTVYTFLRY